MKKEPEGHLRCELFQNVRITHKSIRKVEKEY